MNEYHRRVTRTEAIDNVFRVTREHTHAVEIFVQFCHFEVEVLHWEQATIGISMVSCHSQNEK